MCPTCLDFVENPLATVHFLMQLKEVVKSQKFKSVKVDHSALTHLTPEAALVMAAELYHSSLLTSNVELVVKFPTDEGCKELLGDIGYYKYFGFGGKRNTKSNRFFLEHERGEGMTPAILTKLVDHLKNSLPGTDLTSQLYEAFAEGMQNACEWGYSGKTEGYRSWWLLGYRDVATKEIAYCFYDQGLTIPTTIRTRLWDRVPLMSKSDCELIQHAVNQPYSRTLIKTRGRGLPTLKRFVDEAGRGRLLIFSKRSIYLHEKGKVDVLKDYDSPLNGTLIAWNFIPSDDPPHQPC